MDYGGRRIFLSLLFLGVLVVTAAEYAVRNVARPTFSCKGGTYVSLEGFHGGTVDEARGCQGRDTFDPVVEYEEDTLRIELPIEAASQLADPERVRVQGSVDSHADQKWWVRLIDIFAPLSHVPATQPQIGSRSGLELPQPRNDGDAITLEVGELDPETTILIQASSQQ